MPDIGAREVEMNWEDMKYILKCVFRTLAHAMADILGATLIPVILFTCVVAAAYQDNVLTLCFLGFSIVILTSAAVTLAGRRLGWW